MKIESLIRAALMTANLAPHTEYVMHALGYTPIGERIYSDAAGQWLALLIGMSEEQRIAWAATTISSVYA